jgi:NADH-quinone oxidoreductase subunit L
MGGLRKKLPVTFWTIMCGTLALAGMPPFSGFYSKDAILARAAEQHAYGRFGLGVLVAVLTTFYMFRLVLVVFGGPARSEPAGHAHESPTVMLFPLRILAVFSLIAGVIGVENIYAMQKFVAETAGHSMTVSEQITAPFAQAPLATAFGLLAVLIGFIAAYVLYAKADSDPLPEKLGALSIWMRNRFYFDELYQATVIRLHDFLAAVAAWTDQWIISGLGVRGVHGTTELIGRLLRQLQTGNLQTYAFLFALGVAFVLYLVLK